MTRRAPRLSVLLAGPRAGTNFFADLLSQSPTRVVLSEVFNPSGAFGLNLYPEFSARLEAATGGMEAAHRLLRLAPAEGVEALLAALRPNQTLLIKLHPNQVHAQAVRTIFNNQKPLALFLLRNRLDQYASLCKAQSSGEWFGQDTSALRVTAPPELFLAWAGMLDGWLADMAALCEATDTARLVLRYEADLAQRDARQSQLLPKLQEAGLTLAEADLEGGTFFTKQDSTADSFQKFDNAEALRAGLERFGCLDYAQQAQSLFTEPPARQA